MIFTFIMVAMGGDHLLDLMSTSVTNAAIVHTDCLQ